MQLKFIPHRLINAKNEIVKLHKKVNNEKIMYTEKESEVIKKVVGWDKEQIAIKYLTLTREEQIIIASYLPYNFDHVDMGNLFEVTIRVMDSLIAETLFRQWQYFYKNEECNRFMAELLEKNFVFREIFKVHNYEINHVLNVLKSESVLRQFGKMLYREDHVGEQCQEKLEYHKIGINTMLYGDCIRYVYTFCNRDAYLSNNDGLIGKISSYDNKNKKEFLINFLEELSLADLFNFRSLADFCVSAITGPVDSQKYLQFFDNYSNVIERKYRNWTNTCIIENFFGKDERSKFWKKYRFVSVQRNHRHDMLIMECENHYITEFLGESMGAMYVYEKEFYQKKVTQWQRNFYNTSELKSHMYHNSHMAKKRLEHRPKHSWTWVFKSYILSEKITDTLY